MANEQHAQYSPSSLELLELCPCYVSDRSRDDSAAKDGTRLHEAVELEDLSLCNDEEEEEAVTRCIDFAHEVMSEMGEGCEIFREKLLLIEDLTKGTGDLVVKKDTKANLTDWKFGRNPVTDATENIQMQGYVLGIFHEFEDVEEVEVNIIGPRMDLRSTATYRRPDCKTIRDRILAVIERCEADNVEPSAHEKCCRYCGKKADCPRMAETALAVSRNLGLPLPIEFEPGRMIRPEDRAKAQVLSYILEDWAKKVREYNAKAVVEDGIEIPGFSVRSRKGSTTVVDVHTAIELILKEFGVDRTDLDQVCSLSIPKVTDMLYAKEIVAGGKETKKAIREHVNSLLKEVVSESDTVTFLQRIKGKTNEVIIEELTGQ